MSKGMRGFQKGNKINVGKKYTEERKRKISKAHKGMVISKEIRMKISKSNKGKKRSEETKREMSIARKGKNTWSKGRKHSEETKKKMSLNHSRYWLGKERSNLHSAETKKKMSERMKKTQQGENNYNWQGGKSYEPYSTDWTKTLKRSIRERDRYTCQFCSKQQEDKTFDVHHIDYDKKNCNPENLITLCRKCHIKTNTNRDYWIEYFRTRII